MKIRANRAFEALSRTQNFTAAVAHVQLQPRLHELVQSPLVRRHGSLLFADLWKHTTDREEFEDAAAYEAFMNKFFVEDFLDRVEDDISPELSVLVEQSLKGALVLAERLSGLGDFRLILSVDADLPTASLRFIELRGGVDWGGDDPESFEMEAVLIVDAPASRAASML